MHEIERMIRLVLAPGAQRGSTVRLWVAEASGYGDRKVRLVSEDMERRGVLVRGAWALPAKNGISTLKKTLYEAVPLDDPLSEEERYEAEIRDLMEGRE